MLAVLFIVTGLILGVFQYRKRKTLPEDYRSTPNGLFLMWVMLGVAAAVGTFLIVLVLPNNSSSSNRYPLVPLPRDTTGGQTYYVGESYPLPNGRPVHSFIVNQDNDQTVFRSDLIIKSTLYVGGNDNEAYAVYIQPNKFYPWLFPAEFKPSDLHVAVHVPDGGILKNYHLDTNK